MKTFIEPTVVRGELLTGLIRIDCTPEPPDYSLLTPEEKQRFGKLVHDLKKQGFSLKVAQELAYSRVLCEDMPFDL